MLASIPITCGMMQGGGGRGKLQRGKKRDLAPRTQTQVLGWEEVQGWQGGGEAGATQLK